MDRVIIRLSVCNYKNNIFHIGSVTMGNSKHFCPHSFQCTTSLSTLSFVWESINCGEDVSLAVESIQVKSHLIKSTVDIDSNSNLSTINISCLKELLNEVFHFSKIFRSDTSRRIQDKNQINFFLIANVTQIFFAFRRIHTILVCLVPYQSIRTRHVVDMTVVVTLPEFAVAFDVRVVVSCAIANWWVGARWIRLSCTSRCSRSSCTWFWSGWVGTFAL